MVPDVCVGRQWAGEFHAKLLQTCVGKGSRQNASFAEGALIGNHEELLQTIGHIRTFKRDLTEMEGVIGRGVMHHDLVTPSRFAILTCEQSRCM